MKKFSQGKLGSIARGRTLYVVSLSKADFFSLKIFFSA